MKNKAKNKTLAVTLAIAMLLQVLAIAPLTAYAETVINVTSESQLYDALNKDSTVDKINITQNFTVTKDCSIQFDADHIAYYSDTVMTVAEGVTLTIGNGGVIGSNWPSFTGDWETPPVPNGKVINNGTVIIEDGGKTQADFDTNNGDIIVKSGGEAVCCNLNTGSIVIEDNGFYGTSQGHRAVNKGSLVIHEGAFVEAYMGSSIVNEAEGSIQLDGELYCGCMGIDNNDVLLFENNGGTVTGSGSVYLFQLDPDNLPVSDMDKMIEKMMENVGQTTRFEKWDDINIYRLHKVNSYEDVKKLLTGDRYVAGELVRGDLDIVVDIRNDITIPTGASIGTMALFANRPWTTVTVESGASLSCGMDNEGTVLVKSGGKLATTQGGNIENYGTMVIEKDAELRSRMGGIVLNDGGAELTLDGTFYCGCIGVNGNDICWMENYGNISGNGSVVLYEVAHDELPVSDMNALSVSLAQQFGGGSVPAVSVHSAHVWDAGVVTKNATPTATGVKSYTCTVCGETKDETINKCAKYVNTFKAKGKTVKIKFSALKKKKKSVTKKSAFTLSQAKGKVTFVKVKGAKGITVNKKTGNITVKKGLKKGTYKIKIKVTDAGNATYKAKTVTVTVTIKVK